ncbi:TetR/AcrR family transcriptional regulator [uncultured Amnibacterium sp.]|uniref:TetR/AcrR family transcriptional regulator n=1 Tax=uncultured Amnibacterium sp. TaxID=1631851 RepID=UPI0035CC0D47
MIEPVAASSRDRTRAQLVAVAARLLADGGAEAVTTRSVALAAGVQAPTIYRLFGDKEGLLAAVAEHGFANYVGEKHVEEAGDPVDGLHDGWNLHVGFGLANPALFRLMHTGLRTPRAREILASGTEVLRARVRRVAQDGRLRVTERRAVELIGATGTGIVLQQIEQPDAARDTALPETAWQAVCAAILTDAPASTTGPESAAVALRASLDDLAALTPAERSLLADWLDRITNA